ncbi:MAG TPA: hypothetical protein VJ846_10885 [Sphingomicrobium sp.]|nr:hypothetical protein [Sphingomicrobium sp.]
MPEIQGLLSGVQNLQGSTGLTPAQTGAIGQLTANGQAGNPYSGGTSAAVNNMLAGGGAFNQAPMVQAAYNQYGANTSPLASNTNYDPMSTPGIGDRLAALNDSITQQVNGQFAGAGRFGSAANSKALGQGIAAGEAPILTAQYNQNVQNQQGAAGNLFNAGNTTANTLAGMAQTGVGNQNTGINNVATALNDSQWGPKQTIAAQQLLQSIPASNLGLLAQIGIPLAQLGSSSNGTSNTTQTPSLLTQIGQGTQDAMGIGRVLFGAGF